MSARFASRFDDVPNGFPCEACAISFLVCPLAGRAHLCLSWLHRSTRQRRVLPTAELELCECASPYRSGRQSPSARREPKNLLVRVPPIQRVAGRIQRATLESLDHVCLAGHPLPILRATSPEAPSLHWSYTASSVLRASPPSQTARPFSHELPVDPHRDHRWDFPCCAWSTLPACRRQYPGRSDGICSLIRFGLPRNRGGSAPALSVSGPAQRLLTLRPACSPSRQCDPLHRTLQQLRCLRRCFDCYRVARTSSRAGYSRGGPSPTLSRRIRLADNTPRVRHMFHGQVGDAHRAM